MLRNSGYRKRVGVLGLVLPFFFLLSTSLAIAQRGRPPDSLFQKLSDPYLNLSGGRYNQIPAEIGTLNPGQIEVLDISGLYLSSIPREIGNLSNLVVLYMSGVEPSDLKLPKEIGRLPGLEILHIDCHMLMENLDIWLELPNLREINLSGDVCELDLAYNSFPPEVLINFTEGLYAFSKNLGFMEGPPPPGMVWIRPEPAPPKDTHITMINNTTVPVDIQEHQSNRAFRLKPGERRRISTRDGDQWFSSNGKNTVAREFATTFYLGGFQRFTVPPSRKKPDPNKVLKLRKQASPELSKRDLARLIRTYDFYCAMSLDTRAFANPKGSGLNNAIDFNEERVSSQTVLYDGRTQLYWLALGETSQPLPLWKAIELVNETKMFTYDNWRLPTLEETFSLVKPNRQPANALFLHPAFPKEMRYVGTADTSSIGLNWVVSFVEGTCYPGHFNLNKTTHERFLLLVADKP